MSSGAALTPTISLYQPIFFLGFTALGVVATENEHEASDINGVLYQVAKEEMPNFDRREVGYKKVEVPLKFLKFQPDLVGPTAQTTFDFGPTDKIWLYVPLPSQTMYADENHPLLQSYVDTVLQGCLEWGGQPLAEEFIFTTGGWSSYYLVSLDTKPTSSLVI